MNTSMMAAVLVATLMSVQPIWAHTDEQLDTMPSPHGGQVRAAGPYHLELVAKDGELVLHITDHIGQEVSTEGGEGKANIQQGKAGSKMTIKLEPSQHHLLKGSGEFRINQDTVIVAFIKLPDKDAYAARFIPLKPKSAGKVKKVGEHHDHDHDDHHH